MMLFTQFCKFWNYRVLYFQLKGSKKNGEIGLHGLNAAHPVEEEAKQELENVWSRQLTVPSTIVQGRNQKLKAVIIFLAI